MIQNTMIKREGKGGRETLNAEKFRRKLLQQKKTDHLMLTLQLNVSGGIVVIANLERVAAGATLAAALLVRSQP